MTEQTGGPALHLAADDVADAAARLTGSADVVARAGAALADLQTGASTLGRTREEATRVVAGLHGLPDALAGWSRDTAATAATLARTGSGLQDADAAVAGTLRGLAGPRG